MNNKRQFVKGRNCLYAIFFLLFFSLRLLAVEAVDKKISVSFSNLPLKEAIHEIEVASGYTFFYDGNKIDAAKAALTWVAEKSSDEGFSAVAKLRLAGVLVDA